MLCLSLLLLLSPVYSLDYVPIPGRCSSDDACEIGFKCAVLEGVCVAEEEYVPWVQAAGYPSMVAISIGAGVVMCCLWIVMIPWCCEFTLHMEFDEEEILYFKWCLAVTSVILIVITIPVLVGVSMTFFKLDLRSEVDGTGAPCSALGSPLCGKFGCDITNRMCYTTCQLDVDCASSHMCMPDGQCVLNDGKVSRRFPFPWWGALVLAIVAGCVGAACMTYASTAAAEILNERDKDGVEYEATGPAVWGVACICFLIVGVLVGISCGFSTVEWGDSKVTTLGVPGVSKPRVAVGGVIGIAIAVACVCCCLSVGGSAAAADDSSEEAPILIGFGAVFTVCCVIIITVPVGMATVPIAFAPASDASANCTSLSQCVPYFCDTQSSRCFDSCDSASQCQLGFHCKQSECVAGTKESAPLLNPGAAIGIAFGTSVAVALATLCGCSAASYVMTDRYDKKYWKEDKLVPLMSLNCCWCIVLFVGLSLLLVLLRSSSDVDLSGSSKSETNTTQCAMADAVTCAPFRCNVDAGQCLTKCVDDLHCADSTVCRQGSCVSDNEDSPEHFGSPVIAQWKTFFIVTALIFVGGCGMVVCCGAFITREHWGEWQDDGPLDWMHERVEDHGAQFCGLAVATLCAVILCIFVIGFPLLYVNDSYDIPSARCSTTANCPWGGVCDESTGLCANEGSPSGHDVPTITKKVVPAWAAVVVALSAGLVWSCIAVCSSFAVVEINDEYYVSPRHTAALAVLVCVCCSLPILIPLLVATTTVPDDNAVPIPLPDHNGTAGNITACQGTLSPTCHPYYCNIEESVCLDFCLKSGDCREGYVCANDECVHTGVSTPFPEKWTVFATVAFPVVGGFLVCLLTARCVCGSKLRLGCYGLAAETLAPLICVTVVVTLGFFALSYQPLHEVTTVELSGDTGDQVCTSLYDPTCGSYHCDMRVDTCFTSCRATNDCRRDHICVGQRCEDDRERFSLAVRCSVGGFGLIIFALCINPSARRLYFRVKDASMRKKVEAQEAEKKELADLRARLKDEHPVFIDTEPAGNDITMPTPAPVIAAVEKPLTGRLVDKALSGFTHILSPKTGDDRQAFEREMIESEFRAANELALTTDFGGDDIHRPSPAPPPREDLVKENTPGKPKAGKPTLSAIKLPSDDDDEYDEGGVEMAGVSVLSPGMTPLPISMNVNTDVPLQPKKGPVEAAKAAEAYVPITEAECSICCCDDSTVRLAGRNCSHGYCQECGSSALKEILDSGQFPARCPGCRADDPTPAEDDTKSFIPSNVIEHLGRRAVVTAEFCQRFINMQILRAFERDELMACPVCSVLNVAPRWDLKGKRKRDKYKVECSECEIQFCGKCGVLYRGHEGISCEKYARRQQGKDEVMTQQLLMSTAKRCPGCGMGITHYKNHACHHIRPGTGCPNCHTHFCIVCLRRWPCTATDHGTSCDDRCDCPPCPDCTAGRPCPVR